MQTIGHRSLLQGWLAILCTTLLVLTACGGEAEKSQEQRLEEAIAARDPEQLLKEVSLSKADLPEGFVIVESRFTSNEDAAQQNLFETAGDALKTFERNGRVLSLESEYHPEDLPLRLLSFSALPIAVEVSVTLYASTAGASDAFELGQDMRDRWRASYTAALADSPDFSNVRSVDSRDVRIGDESFSFGFTGDVHYEDSTVPVFYDFLAFRSGPFLAVVVTGSTFKPPTDEADRLGKRLAALFEAKTEELGR